MKKNIWQDNVADGLITQIPRTSRFKNEIPGRLFVSSVNWRTLKITQDVDYHLQSIVREISSYIRDINDFLCKLKYITEFSENFYLLKIDVKSLCTNIPNLEVIQKA